MGYARFSKNQVKVFELSLTTFDQLLGFICPVHTPDGAPCGLLNHLSAFCRIVTETQDCSQIINVLVSLGMSPIGQNCPYPIKGCYRVILDGKILGYVPDLDAIKIVDKMRLMKIENDKVGLYLYAFNC